VYCNEWMLTSSMMTMMIMISCTASKSFIYPSFNSIFDPKLHSYIVIGCMSFDTGIFLMAIYSDLCSLHLPQLVCPLAFHLAVTDISFSWYAQSESPLFCFPWCSQCTSLLSEACVLFLVCMQFTLIYDLSV
jgi:hypothetical protein